MTLILTINDVPTQFPHAMSTISLVLGISILLWSFLQLRAYWAAPRLSPLNAIRGPPVKHWFFGFLTPDESQTFQMCPRILEYCAHYNGTWASTFINRKPTLVLGDLVGAHHVLNNAKAYVRVQAQMRTTRLIFGDGLVGVDGAQHARQRKTVGPSFNASAISNMAPVFMEVSRNLSLRWQNKLRNTQGDTKRIYMNVYSEFEKLSLDIIGKVGFGYDFKSIDGQRSELEAAFVNVTKAAATGSVYSLLRSQFSMVAALGQWFVKEQIVLDRLKTDIRTISRKLVDKAKEEAANFAPETAIRKKKNILGLLVEANLAEDVKNRLGDDEIISMIPTILSGGYDNNASVMSYAVYGLALHPKSQHRLREELRHPPAGYETWQEDPKALERLPYLDAVCRETLRLYTSAHSIPRTATQHDFIPLGKTIKLQNGRFVDCVQVSPGDDIVIPQKWMNVDPSLWGPDSKTFRPERWIQDEGHPYYDGGLEDCIRTAKHSGWSRLMTFSVGPRNCIGYRMAVAEFKACIASLIFDFEFIEHASMKDVYGEVQIVDRPRLPGVEGYCMPCWVKKLNMTSQ